MHNNITPRWLPKDYKSDFFHIEKRLSQLSATCLLAPIGGALKILFGLGQIFYGIIMTAYYQISALYSRVTSLMFSYKGIVFSEEFHKKNTKAKEELRNQCLKIALNGSGNMLMGTLETIPGVALARIVASKGKTDENFAIMHY